ncbi:MAG TPA: lysine biosynthesis protein LysW [Candidatus Micrarchaeia archaeon]|nr:lysine biosynthesis protein LysW [Candidatus Micrarchaeia archaeon]
MDPAPPAVREIPCPDCGRAVEVTLDTEVGELVECGGCGAPFEVVALVPLTLAPFDEEEK